MRQLTTGQVAKEAGVNVQTIRYYERRGLISKPPRRATGYRLYPEETVKCILFIRRAKELGFSLNEIAELLALRSEPGAPCSRVRRRASAKIADIDGKISALQSMKNALEVMVKACSGRGPAAGCPILSALDAKARPETRSGKKGGARK